MLQPTQTDTRIRLLDAAEQLFARQGVETTTLRQVTSLAQANIAAVNYYFGGKDGLVEEVFRRRLSGMNLERIAELDRLETLAEGQPLKPHQIVEAFFGVALRMAEADVANKAATGNQAFLHLLSRSNTTPDQFIRHFLAEEHAAVLGRFKTALFRSLPGVPKTEILWRFHFMLGAASYAISGVDGLSLMADWKEDTDDQKKLPARLMAFLLGGLRAPLPDTATQQAGSIEQNRTNQEAS